MTTLSETRSMTIDGAKAALEQLAHAACRLAAKKAKKEKRLLEIESTFEEETKADAQEAERLTLLIREFCRGNPHLFTKPRKMKTPFGEFGMQTVSDLKIDNEEALILVLTERGLEEECIKTVRKPDKDAVRALIEAGQTIPGATVRVEPNDPVVKVSRPMLQAAVEKA